jgi:hypothetical protein
MEMTDGASKLREQQAEAKPRERDRTDIVNDNCQ